MSLWSQPFREARRSKSDHKYMKAFTWFANEVFNGAAWTGTYFREVRLVAIKQPSGRHRPIQIAETLDRFLGKALLSQSLSALRTHFGDMQTVVAEAGADKVIHYVRSHLQQPDSSMVMLDFSNAFNEVSRAAIRRELKQHFPYLLPFFDLRYRHSTTVHFGDLSFPCDEGVRQGDPWGAVFFALALHPVLQRLQEKHRDHVTLRAYADDVNSLAHTRAVDWYAFLVDTVNEAATIGMQVRLSKSGAYAQCFSIHEVIPPEMQARLATLPVVDPGSKLALHPPESGVVLLGAPIGSDTYVRDTSLRLIHELGAEMQLLHKIETMPQEYYLLLQRCFNTKALHLARWVPPSLLEAAATAHDANVDALWSRLAPGLISEPTPASRHLALRWARLPAKHGGVGLTSLHAVRHPAFLSSVARAWHSFGTRPDLLRAYFGPLLAESIQHIANCLPVVTNTSDDFPVDVASDAAGGRRATFTNLFTVKRLQETLTPEYLRALFDAFARGAGRSNTAQRRLTSIVNSRAHCEILSDFFQPTMSTGDLAKAAHFLSASCTEAVAWATSIPSDADFIIPPEEYRWLLAHHFWLPVPDRGLLGSRCSDSRHQLDQAGHHLFGCGSYRAVTHDNIRDRLHAFCSDAGLKPTLEPANLLYHPETGVACERRPDISVGAVDPQGRLLLLDVTTTDASCAKSVTQYRSAQTPAGAARGAESRKVDKYQGWTDPATQSFMPLAFELSGRWGPLATRFFDLVKDVGRARRGHTDQRHSFWAAFWKRVISVGLQRDVAQSALRIRDYLVDYKPPRCRAPDDLGRV